MTSRKYCFTTLAKPFGVAFAIRPIPRKFCFAKPMGCDGAKKTTLFMQHNFHVAMPKKPFGVAFTIRPMHHKFCFAKLIGSSGAKETAAAMPFHSCFAAPFNIISLHLISISQYFF
ncbi:MAG: hypothetical protein HXL35_00185 [Prevotellaceae bacterium]|nr:hypothetical protein [Prevotellaceae bacterium]